MKAYQRACLIVAQEGVSGLSRRVMRKLTSKTQRPQPSPSNPKVLAGFTDEYSEAARTFLQKAKGMGHGDLSKYYWYHTIDLGNGLMTPGDYDFRSSLPSFGFPPNMKGMDVLDIGSATGFFSFEFERRGANVTSVELPSIADWDMPLGEDRAQTLKELMAYHQVGTVEEVQYLHLDGPFEFCRKVLNSTVRRCHSTIYELSAQKLGMSGFDLVFIGDVLLHTFSPLKALVSVAPLCRNRLIISQLLADVEDGPPVMQYLGGENRRDDCRTWWLPNEVCLVQILRRLGFRDASVVGHHTGTIRRGEHPYRRAIIHATK